MHHHSLIYSLFLIIYDRTLSKLDMVTEPTNARKCIIVLYYKHSIPPTRFGHSAAILMGMHYNGWLYRDITNVCAMHRCKILSFNSA
jgi:hypothetical protein